MSKEAKKLSRREFMKVAALLGTGALTPFLQSCLGLGKSVEAIISPQPPSISGTFTPIPPNSLESPTPSVPMIEVGGLQIPDPHVSNPELFDVTKPDSPIVEFANAFGVTPEEVGELTPEVKTAADGSQFAVLTTSDLPSTADFDESGTPLMIAEQGENGEWVWSENRLQDSPDIIFMTTVDLGDENHNDPQYDLTARKNFSGIVISGGLNALWIDQYPPNSFVNLIQTDGKLNNTRVTVFYHKDVPDSEKQNVQFMEDRINQITPWIKKMSDNGKNNIIINIGNETMWFSNGQTGFEKGYPFFSQYGEGWIKEATIKLIDSLKVANIPLDNITFEIDNEYRIEIPKGDNIKKAEFVVENASQIANEIQQSFPDNKLNFSLGLQFHVGKDSDGYLRVDPNFFNDPNAVELLANHFITLSNNNQFTLNISELDFDSTVSQEDKIKIIKIIITASRKAGFVKSINFWNGLRNNADNTPSLFDLSQRLPNGEYPKTLIYYAALQESLP